MKTTFDLPKSGTGRIANLVYTIDGEKLPRAVTTAPDEKACDAIARELFRIWSVPVTGCVILDAGEQYQFTFLDGQVKAATVI